VRKLNIFKITLLSINFNCIREGKKKKRGKNKSYKVVQIRDLVY